MPREVVHWHVIDSAVERLAPGSKLRELLQAYPEVYRLGALAHDGPFYLNGGRHELSEVASVLHGGIGGDPFAPFGFALKSLARNQPLTSDGRATQSAVSLSFLLGMLSHAVTDICFHPFVFYWTGEYADPDSERRRLAQQRHRILEVYLDIWFAGEKPRWSRYRIEPLLERLGEHRIALHRFLAELLLPGIRQAWPEVHPLIAPKNDETSAANWLRGLDDMAFYQKFFLSTIFGVGATLLARWAPERFAALEALFRYGRKQEVGDMLDVSHDYANPLTGETFCHSPRELAELAITRCVDVFNSIEHSLCFYTNTEHDCDFTEVEAFLAGVSLNYGCPNLKGALGMHFSNKGLELPGLQ